MVLVHCNKLPSYGVFVFFVLVCSPNVTMMEVSYFILFVFDMVYVRCFPFQTYIGSILAAVNPYRSLNDFYTPDLMMEYSVCHIGEKPPHIFAIANECYYSLIKKGQHQCVLIRYIYIGINLIQINVEISNS